MAGAAATAGGSLQQVEQAALVAIAAVRSMGVALSACTVAAPTRNPFLPGVPTILEQGVKDLDITSIVAWFGPAGMKPEVVQKLNAALKVAIAQPAVATNYNLSAYTAESSTPQELAAEVKRAYEAWGRLVKAADIQKQ